MTIPKAYQTGFSQSPLNEPLRDKKGFFVIYQIYNHLKYYFVFVSISCAFVLCLGKVFQRIETSSQDNLSFSRTMNNKYQGKNEDSSSFFASIGKFLPFKIGKDAKAATNSTAGNISSDTAQKSGTPEFDPLSTSSEEEVKLLETLAHRREELDKRETDIAKKELLITTAQNQIKEEMASLQKLKADIEETLKTADKAEKDKIMTLVKIYENMKPKEAAHIFNQMDVRLLADVAKLMNQKKFSVILGLMNVYKAKELTTLIINLKSPYAKAG